MIYKDMYVFMYVDMYIFMEYKPKTKIIGIFPTLPGGIVGFYLRVPEMLATISLS